MWTSARSRLAALAVLAATPALAQHLYVLQQPGQYALYPTAISADGSTVVGQTFFSVSDNHAFRWTASSGISPLINSYYQSAAVGVSADGSTIVGNMGTPAHPDTDTQIFRWTLDGAPSQIEQLDPFHDGSLAYCNYSGGVLDADGVYFVGVSSHGGFRSDGNATDVISNPVTPQYGVTPICISANGRVAGGQMPQSVFHPCDFPACRCTGVETGCFADQGRAFVWESGGGTLALGAEMLNATVYALSGDGNIAVGNEQDYNSLPHAMRWGPAGGHLQYAIPGSVWSEARAISADGTTVGGSYHPDVTATSYAWIARGNDPPIDLPTHLQALGLDVSGWTSSAVQAISMDGMVITGIAVLSNNAIAGFVADLHKDTDGDGLYDDWETDGIPYIVNGQVHRYPLPGANPLRKDIYVEVDWMVGYRPIQNALDRVSAVFDQAPVAAPAAAGGLPGITLHIDVAQAGIPARSYPGGWTEFQTDKAQNFGTPGERGDQNWPAIKKAKAKAYRYCIFGVEMIDDGDPVLGLGECDDGSPEGPRMGGNDFVVTLGNYTPPPTVSMEDITASTFMHELGHTLGLFHGGGLDSQNFNPNDYSCMNYMWVGTREYAPPGRRTLLDYSRVTTPELYECSLIESLGIGGNDADLVIPYVVPRPGLMTPCTPHTIASQFGSCDAPMTLGRCIRYARFSGPVDWNNDGVVSGLLTPVCADPNGSNSGCDVLYGVNEWDLLAYNFRDSTGYLDSAPPPHGPRCPTYAEEQFYESLPPPPPIPPCTGAAPQANAPTPATGTSCSLFSATFQADFAGAGPFTIRWRWLDTSTTPATWTDFNEGTMAHGTVVSGVEAGALTINHASPLDLHSNSVQVAYHLTDRCGLSADSPESTLQTTCAPANDTCANAAPLPAGVTVSGTTIEATQDSLVSCGNDTGPDVWYIYQPATGGAVTISTCGSSMDTILAAYTGACGALTQIACNDDSCGLSSSVSIPTTAGQAYFVRVSRFGSGTGNFVVRANPLVPPPNDACASAVFIADNVTVNGTNVNATQDGNASCVNSGADVWYAYRPQTAATVNVNTCGSTFDTTLTVFTGVCGALTEIACNDDSCGAQSSLSFAGAAGQTYLIRFSGYNGRTGDFVLRAVGGGGVIPPSCGSADFNCDGDLGTDADLESFFACLAGNCPAPPCTSGTDFNHDGDLGTDADIESFFRVLAGGNC